MTATIVWSIPDLKYKAKDGCVYQCDYCVNAVESTQSVGTGGSIYLDEPGENFIPLESLTEEIVVQWVKDKLAAVKCDEIEKYLIKQLDFKDSSENSSGVPWNK